MRGITRMRPAWLVILSFLSLALLCIVAQIFYVTRVLDWARGQGVYETPQKGVIDRASRFYCGIDRIEINHASTNSFDGSNPHIWYVIWRVYATNHAPCDPDNPGAALYHGTYENGGNFYLQTRQGWVFMPEGFFPEFIGEWMKVLGLAGPGDPFHIPRSY